MDGAHLRGSLPLDAVGRTGATHALHSLPLDAVSHITPFLDLTNVAKLATADKHIDGALRTNEQRQKLLHHLDRDRCRVGASTSLEHVALADAAREWEPLAAVRGAAELADPEAVDARCRQIAALLRRHGTATVRVEAHCDGVDVRPWALAHALSAERARRVAARLAAAARAAGLPLDVGAVFGGAAAGGGAAGAPRVALANVRPRAFVDPANTRVEVYLRLPRGGDGFVEMPPRRRGLGASAAPAADWPRRAARATSWPLRKLVHVARAWLVAPAADRSDQLLLAAARPRP